MGPFGDALEKLMKKTGESNPLIGSLCEGKRDQNVFYEHSNQGQQTKLILELPKTAIVFMELTVINQVSPGLNVLFFKSMYGIYFFRLHTAVTSRPARASSWSQPDMVGHRLVTQTDVFWPTEATWVAPPAAAAWPAPQRMRTRAGEADATITSTTEHLAAAIWSQ